MNAFSEFSAIFALELKDQSEEESALGQLLKPAVRPRDHKIYNEFVAHYYHTAA
jgi:hypothetical protein